MPSPAESIVRITRKLEQHLGETHKLCYQKCIASTGETPSGVWDAYRQMDAKFVFLVGGWPQDLFRERLDSDLLIAEEIKLPWAPEGRPACYFERSATGHLKSIVLLVPHPEAYRRRRNRDERKPSAQLHAVAFRERFFDLVDVYLNNDVSQPALLSSAKIFRCTAGGLAIPPSTFLQKDRQTLATLFRRPGVHRNVLADHVQANLGLNRAFYLSIWDEVHTTPLKAPAYWTSQEAVDQFGSVAVIFKRAAQSEIQRSNSRRLANKKRREQEPSRHEKKCNECGEMQFLCMRGPKGGRSLCLGCGKAWLRQQPMGGEKVCTGCGNGWGVSRVWLNGPAGKKTICKNCFVLCNEYRKAVEYARKQADRDDDKENVPPTE